MKQLILIAMMLPMIWLSSCSKDEDTTPQTYEDGSFAVKFVGGANWKAPVEYNQQNLIVIYGLTKDSTTIPYKEIKEYVFDLYGDKGDLATFEAADVNISSVRFVDNLRIKEGDDGVLYYSLELAGVTHKYTLGTKFYIKQ